MRKSTGPGSFLHDLIKAECGASPTFSCGCDNRIAQMNAWGVDGCSEHFDEIVAWLLEAGNKKTADGEPPKKLKWKCWLFGKLPAIAQKVLVENMVRKAIGMAEESQHVT